MGSSIRQLIRDREESITSVNNAFANSSHCYVIHYSCESFYDAPGGRSTRITSIAVRNLSSAQTHHWALNRSAELLKLDVADPQNLDELEFHMLNKYFEFLRLNARFLFMHWNMRDNNYGFQALEHRFSVLGGDPFLLSDDRKLDLARVANSIYGRDYIRHIGKSGRKGRLLAIVDKNGIADKDVMAGADEAEAYIKGKYRELEMSTLRKVDIISNIAERIHDRSLKTDNKWYRPLSFHPLWLGTIIKEHPLFIAIGVLITLLTLYNRGFEFFHH